MKLSKAEIASIIITVLFMLSASAITFHNQSSDSVTVSFESIEDYADNSMASDNTGDQSTLENEALININIATEAELCSLPGIGEVLAGRIVQYRNDHGQFQSIDEIMDISGIGVSKFEKIKGCITVTQTGG